MPQRLTTDYNKMERQRVSEDAQKKQAELEFLRRMSNISLEQANDEEFYTIKDIHVTNEMIRHPLKNPLVLSLKDDTEASENDWDTAWVVVSNSIYTQINSTVGKRAKERNQIDGKKVRVRLQRGHPNGSHLMCVRRETYVAWDNRKSDEEKSILLLADLVKDMKRKITMAKAIVKKDASSIKSICEQSPELCARLKDLIEEQGSFLGVKLRYKSDNNEGCDMFGEHNSRFVAEHGPVTEPKRLDDIPGDQELRTKKHHKAIMVLDKRGKGVCVSPELRAKSGKSYPEDHYPSTYHNMTDVINIPKEKLPMGKDGEEMPYERIWGDMAFCAQHGARDQENCKSSAEKQYPLSNKKKSISEICEWNEEADRCDPKFGDGNDKSKEAAKKIYPDFFDREMDYIESQMKARIQRRRRGKRPHLPHAHRVAGNGEVRGEYMKIAGGN